MSGLRTRVAPTPSGYLHEGNAANALLVSWLAAEHAGAVVLRIDAARARPEYVDDVFYLLAWLDITWDEGPRDPQDLDRHHSQTARTSEYRAALATAVARGLEVYACTCSRRDLRGPAEGGCPAGCRTAARDHEPGQTVLRAHVPVGTVVEVGGVPVALDPELGDFVVWRRDDLPSYHLASVVDDERLGITDVVRGADLLVSSAAQLFLAGSLGAATFRAARFHHHELVTAPDGTKLSKSQSVRGAPLPRDEATRHRVHDLAQALGRPLGITRP